MTRLCPYSARKLCGPKSTKILIVYYTVLSRYTDINYMEECKVWADIEVASGTLIVNLCLLGLLP